MKNNSPLRYPGGKSAMANLLCRIRLINKLGNRSIAEPFAGGAGASLSLLYLEETQDIYINDADPSIYNFWWAIINRPIIFSKLIEATSVTMPEWYRQREIYNNPKRYSRVRHGYSAFFLNRCNRSGIISNGGPIGGIKQKGKWKLDARFNKYELSFRCKKVAEYNKRIHLSANDGIEFINGLEPSTTFYFIDPPYFNKGKTLYLNKLNEEYHFSLAQKLKSLPDEAWVLTYDDCPEIRKYYRGWTNIKQFAMRYSAAERRAGREILITPKWMQLPDSQTSMAINWK